MIKLVYQILFLIILIGMNEWKNEWNCSLIFCDNNKYKNINIYFKIIKQIRDEVFSFTDEFEDDDFIFVDDFTRFRFIKNDNVIDYDDNDEDDDILTNFKFITDDICYTIKKNNIPVCVISRSSVSKKESIHYPILRLQKCFYENESF